MSASLMPEQGLRDQVLFTNRSVFPHGRCSAPRILNLDRVLREYDLYDRWIFAGHARTILGRHHATDVSTCWALADREHLLFRKTGIIRIANQRLRRVLDPDVAVVCTVGSPRASDVKTLAVEIQISFGAHGGTLEEFPVDGLPDSWMLARVQNYDLFRAFVAQNRQGTDRNGRAYGFSGQCHYDPSARTDRILSEADALTLIRDGAKFVQPVARSNFSVSKVEGSETKSSWEILMDEIKEKAK